MAAKATRAKRQPVTGVLRGDGRPWYPIECEHGYDCCPTCDGIPENPDVQRAGGEAVSSTKATPDDTTRQGTSTISNTTATPKGGRVGSAS